MILSNATSELELTSNADRGRMRKPTFRFCCCGLFAVKIVPNDTTIHFSRALHKTG